MDIMDSKIKKFLKDVAPHMPTLKDLDLSRPVTVKVHEGAKTPVTVTDQYGNSKVIECDLGHILNNY